LRTVANREHVEMADDETGEDGTHGGLTDEEAYERERLRPALVRLLGVLAGLGVISSAAIAWALQWDTMQADLRLLLLGLFGGMLGSCVAASVSAAQRYADGIETRRGVKIPRDGPAERFNEAMVPFFYLRPFLGASMGIVAYAGLVAGLLFTTGSPDARNEIHQVNPEAVLFFGTLAGLFAKTLIERLKDTFDAFLGK
jgi:hypothetical protein